MKKISAVVLSLMVLASCGNNVGSSGSAFSEEGYELSNVPGANIQKAIKKNVDGIVVEEGYLSNGIQTGSWITYHPDNQLPKSMVNYANGMRNGLYLEFNDRGQIELRASYKNNQLHGAWGKYRFGRPTNTAFYDEGELDGVYKEYNMRDGKLIKEISYKSGKYDGPYKFYNDKGEVTLSYEYKNGEKVSGGIIQEEPESK